MKNQIPEGRMAFKIVETADLLGISKSSVRRLISRGLLKSTKILRHKLIPRAEIEKLLQEAV